MSVNVPLLQTIEPDEAEAPAPSGRISSPLKSTRREPVVLTPTNHTSANALNSNATPNELEGGMCHHFHEWRFTIVQVYFSRVIWNIETGGSGRSFESARGLRHVVVASFRYFSATLPFSDDISNLGDVALFFLYLFRIAAFTTYILCGFFTNNYVLSVRHRSVSREVDLNIFFICRPW